MLAEVIEKITNFFSKSNGSSNRANLDLVLSEFSFGDDSRQNELTKAHILNCLRVEIMELSMAADKREAELKDILKGLFVKDEYNELVFNRHCVIARHTLETYLVARMRQEVDNLEEVYSIIKNTEVH